MSELRYSFIGEESWLKLESYFQSLGKWVKFILYFNGTPWVAFLKNTFSEEAVSECKCNDDKIGWGSLKKQYIRYTRHFDD